MQRVLVFPEETIVGPATPGEPDMLVKLDPETFDAEVVLDRALVSLEPGGPFYSELAFPELRAPPAPEKPFRAVVSTAKLHGLDVRPPLMPGARLAASVACGVRTTAPEHLLTDVPVKVTTGGAQALELARELLDGDELVAELRVLSLSGGGAVTVELQTGMQNQSPVGWVSAGQFSAVGSAPAMQLVRFTHLLRYVRWNVIGLTGASPSATFFLSAIERRWSKDSSPPRTGPPVL